MELISPKDIYKEVLKETNKILKTFEEESESAELNTALETAHDNFEILKHESDKTLEELDKSAEWNAFTIAFYGETNAGKSTIIETLRILMGEKSKQDQQEKYRQTCKKFNVDEQFFYRWEIKKQEILEQEEELKRMTQQFTASYSIRKTQENELIFRSEQIKNQIKNLPFWRRGLSFLWKIPENDTLKLMNEKLNNYLIETSRLSKVYEFEKKILIEKIELLKKTIDDFAIGLQELERHQDGAIIGDGQSDFTRESTSYEFDSNGNKIFLLDVPGIEGKEELVRDPIMKAVRKAHAVFYVTRKADPPQKGDEKTGIKGTLEKIKDHLGSQTEVWTIFNKSIKSPEALRSPNLVNNGELDSLKVLEDEMRLQLGDHHYAGSFRLSAYPAFVTSTEHFLPNSPRSKDRNKFLAVMNPAEIMQKSEFKSFAEKIFSDMAENTQKKIRKSNFNKANDSVVNLKKNVSNLNNNTFKPLFENLENQANDSSVQIENAISSLEKNFESTALLLIKKKRDNVRKKIYEDIEKKLTNDDLKYILDKYIKEGINEITIELPEIFKSNFKTFEEQFKDIVNQFLEHTQEFINDASMAGDMNFKLNLKIDTGINFWGLIGSVAGAISLLFGTAGWVLVVSAIGVVISLGKAIVAYFDADYQKAQQRKTADNNIKKIFDSLELSYVAQIRNNIQKLEENLEHFKNKFWVPAKQAEQITISLKHSIKQLDILSKKIILEKNKNDYSTKNF